MDITRRTFLVGTAVGVGMETVRAAGTGPSAGAEAPKGAPNVTFGVLSDVHLERRGDEDTLIKALEYFRDNGADGVLIAGDIANTGRIEQIERAANCFWRVFPNGKAPDGRHVEQLWVYGNHDVCGWAWHKGKD